MARSVWLIEERFLNGGWEAIDGTFTTRRDAKYAEDERGKWASDAYTYRVRKYTRSPSPKRRKRRG